MKSWIRKTLGVVVLGALLGVATVALAPSKVPVETSSVTRGPLRVVVQGTGKVRMREVHRVSAPAGGHLERIGLRPGDSVEKGALLAVLVPAAPAILDARSRAEVEARLGVVQAAEKEASAAVGRAKLELTWAEQELTRAEELYKVNSIPQRALDSASFDVRARKKAVEAAELSHRTAQKQVETVRSTLGQPAANGGRRGERIEVHAAHPGVVLRVLADSEGLVQAGTPLLETGDPKDVEVVAELLTTDAVRVRKGASVELDGWGGNSVLTGVVRTIEPSAMTKVSALGVEEQRVNVCIEPVGAGWEQLGDGYRVEAHIVVWENTDVVRVPVGAMFLDGNSHAVLTVENGVAVRRSVRVGQRGTHAAEVVEGLSEGQKVVVYPGERVAAGVKVREN